MSAGEAGASPKSRKLTRRHVAWLLALVLVVHAAIGAVFIYREVRDRQAAAAYERVNVTFRMGNVEQFVDPTERFPVLDDGTPMNVMIVALWFNEQRWRAGISVEPREIARFFESEFEPNGSRRLYNNGLHPDVQMIVEHFNPGGEVWMREMSMQSFLERLDYSYSRNLEEQLDGAVPTNPDFPMSLAEVRQSAIWLELISREPCPRRPETHFRRELRAILEPIYGWPEP